MTDLESHPSRRGGQPRRESQGRLFPDTTTPPDYSIVVPVFNEESCVEPLYEQVLSATSRIDRPFELVYVDDGSTDETFEKARALAHADARVRVIRLRRNYGQSMALQEGFDHSRGQIIVTMDGDLQNDPDDIPRLLAEIENGFDIVSGWRRDRQDNFLSRKIPSWVANKIIVLLTGVQIHDQGCSLKAYRRELTERIALYADMHRFVIVLMAVSGGRYKELVVNHRPRTLGKSKYGIARTWKVLLDLITIVMITRFISRPAQWFGLLSLPFLGMTLLAAVAAMLPIFREPTGSALIVPAGVTLLSAFGFAHLILMACIGELIVRFGDYRDTVTVLLGSISTVTDRETAHE